MRNKEKKNIIKNINQILKSPSSNLSKIDREKLIIIREKIKHTTSKRWLLHWLALLVDFLMVIN